jgi:hypothetical protein
MWWLGSGTLAEYTGEAKNTRMKRDCSWVGEDDRRDGVRWTDKVTDTHEYEYSRRTRRAQAKERRQRSGEERSHDGVLVGQAWRLTPGKIGQFAGIKRRKEGPALGSESSSVSRRLPAFLLFVTSSTTHLAPSLPSATPLRSDPLQQGNLLFS